MSSSSSAKVKIQRFGNNLSSMIMPNIGAFIAWGLITAMFIPVGWFPNETLSGLVEPMVSYLLPLLIGYSGGKLVYDTRGGVVGAIATMGVIVGADMPMFIGAMVMGPIGGYIIKSFDKIFLNKIKSGFEMLVNNFSAGILGALLATLALVAITPIVEYFITILSNAIEALIHMSLLPLVNIIIEPAKVLFLNNAINHGVLTPIATNQVQEIGKSILFLLETNPGPGLGVLLAYCFFGKKSAKSTAPGAILIHFFGGIHEIYFPYILMNPILILAVIAGGISGTLMFTILDAGLQSAASPGSIVAILAFAKGSYVGVLSGVLVSTIVSFIISVIILKVSKNSNEDLEAANQKTKELKGKSSDVLNNLEENARKIMVKKIIFACDAGMGSSAMGASIMRKKITAAGLNIEVTNTAISKIPDDSDIIITHKDLTDRAKEKQPKAEHVSVENFLNSPKYDELVESLKK